LCSIPELTSKHQRVSVLPAEHAAFLKEQLIIVIGRQVLSRVMKIYYFYGENLQENFPKFIPEVVVILMKL